MSLKSLFAVCTIAIAACFAPSAAQANDGNFMIRVLGTGVLPDADADVSAPGGPVIPNFNADVSDEFIPATTLTYFFSPNLAAELFCCFAKHQADGTQGLAAAGEIADFWIFPPSLTLQYHVTGMGGFKPYVGVGLTYINFFDEEATDLANTSVDIDDAFGLALQAGVDISMGSNWYLNLDVKKVFIETDVKWRGATNLDADLDVDPWIVSAGIGYRFDLGDLFGRRHAEPLK